MVDIAFGPEPGKRPDATAPGAAYLAATRKKRLYGGLLLIFFVATMASGFLVAQDRNAGDFLDGLHRLDDFPAEVLSEAWEKRANLPGLMWSYTGSLVETINQVTRKVIRSTMGENPECVAATTRCGCTWKRTHLGLAGYIFGG